MNEPTIDSNEKVKEFEQIMANPIEFIRAELLLCALDRTHSSSDLCKKVKYFDDAMEHFEQAKANVVNALILFDTTKH